MLVRMYTGADGHSHFEELDAAEVQKRVGITVGKYTPGNVYDWHIAPEPLTYVALTGTVEYEVHDGTKRRFGPGDVILVEDTSGTGHVSRTIGENGRTYVVVRHNRGSKG